MQEITRNGARFDGDESEIDLHDVAIVLWTRKWLIFAAIFVGALAFGGATFLVDKEYTAIVIVSPVSGSSMNGALGAANSLASQLGGLSAIAGFAPSSDSKKSETIAALQSERLTERFIRDNELLPILYEEKWDKDRSTWKVTEAGKRPSLWKANILFKKKIRTVTTDAKTGLVTVAIKWKDPHLAAEWANGIVQMTNNYLRDQAILETERNVAFLKEQASKTDILGVKQAIFTLLQNEMDKQMLARGNSEFAVKVVDPAFVPEIPSSPIRILWVFVGAVSGMFTSAFFILMRNSSRTDVEAQ